MGVLENKIFLSIEDTISAKASALINGLLDDDIRQAGELIDQGKFNEARAIINAFDVSQEVFELDGFLNIKFIQAALFGSSQLVDPEESIFMLEPHLTDIFPIAINQFREILNASIKIIQATAGKFIRAQEEDAVDVEVTDGIIKAWGGHPHEDELFKSDFTNSFNSTLAGNLNMMSAIAANLTVSRVITYGFLVEASANGIQQYMVSEILDERTCPVCELMHGTVFEVETALARVVMLLNVTDPAELKSAAPFASQSAANLAELRLLSSEDLQVMGMDTPPYHPLCRGITVEIGRDIGAITPTITPVRPGIIPGAILPGVIVPTVIQPPQAPIDPPTEGRRLVTAQEFQSVATGIALQTLTGDALDNIMSLIITDPTAAALLLGILIEDEEDEEENEG
jgi:hypothetical protein